MDHRTKRCTSDNEAKAFRNDRLQILPLVRQTIEAFFVRIESRQCFSRGVAALAGQLDGLE